MNCSHLPLPTTCIIEFNTTCTLNCGYCPIHSIPRYGTVMTDATFRRIVEQIRSVVTYVYIGGYGEFLLHPHFAEYVRELKTFARLNLATNLTVLSDENLKVLDLIDDLSVSISADDANSYIKIHGKDYFETVRSNLGKLKRPVSITTIATSISKGTKPLGLPLRDRMKHLWTPKLSRFDLVDGELRLKTDPRTCRDMWDIPYFLSNGQVTFCCYDFDGLGNMGNINNQAFDGIWNGETYKSLRENHLKGNLHPVCQNQCSRMR